MECEDVRHVRTPAREVEKAGRGQYVHPPLTKLTKPRGDRPGHRPRGKAPHGRPCAHFVLTWPSRFRPLIPNEDHYDET